MALGGGTFTTMNKVLPGAYINFVSSTGAGAVSVNRGVVAMAMDFDWGPEATVFEVTRDEFYRNAWKYFGHSANDSALKPLRDLYMNAVKAYFYKAQASGTKATCTYADAKYPGTAGNRLKIVIQANEASTLDSPLYDVITQADDVVVDKQMAVSAMSGLVANDYVDWKTSATIATTAGTSLTGGANGSSSSSTHQLFLDAIQSYSFDILGCYSSTAEIKALYVAFTKRMRDQMGVKFQLVVHNYASTDYEGVISVKNNTSIDLVPWVCGAEAACPINQSISNKAYDGEYTVTANYTQTQLEAALAAGELVFHRVADEFRVLQDINTLVTFTSEKGEIFRENPTIRIIDYIGNYVAQLFNTQYYGLVANDPAGRTQLRGDIITLLKNLQTLGAVTEFSPDDVQVEAGEEKGDVIVNMAIVVAGMMTKLYMTVVVN